MGATASTIDLTMCVDCAHTYANGIDEHDADQRAHVLTMAAYTKDWRGHVAVGEHVSDFSSTRCDCCGTDLAGHRFTGALFGSMGGA